MGAHHQRVSFHLGFDRQGQVNGHLVTVEVRIETFADQGVQVDGIAFDECWFEGLDTHAVERRVSVQKHGVVADDLFEDIPNFVIFAFEHFLCGLDRVGMPEVFEFSDDKRLVEFQSDLLGQSALVETQTWSDDDHRAGRVVDSFSEKVFAEPTLLALDHIRQGLQWSVAASENWAFASTVVKQSIDRLLEHSFFVADDDFGRVEIDQLAQSVVAVDDPSVQIVEVGGCEVPAIEKDQRSQVRRNDGDNVEDHPLGTIFAIADRFDELESIDQFLFALFAAGLLEFCSENFGEFDQVEILEKLTNGFGTHIGFESIAVLGPG